MGMSQCLQKNKISIICVHNICYQKLSLKFVGVHGWTFETRLGKHGRIFAKMQADWVIRPDHDGWLHLTIFGQKG